MMAQISASIDQNTVNSISALAKREKRSFSSMVGILLDEAVSGRVGKILDKRLISKSSKK